MEIQYDRVLIDGNEAELMTFAADEGVVVDWRDEDESIVASFSARLEDEDLSAEYREDEDFSGEDVDLIVNRNGVRHPVRLPLSGKARYATIRGLIGILRDDYEIRVFESSLAGDTHVFYVKPTKWWAALDARFPERMRKIFGPIDEELDFFAGRARIYAFGPES